jgi:hypothetical protein
MYRIAECSKKKYERDSMLLQVIVAKERTGKYHVLAQSFRQA